jgi:EAL domain-containing protein (putative c-di-GMP-specific phosphodiesterase class I)
MGSTHEDLEDPFIPAAKDIHPFFQPIVSLQTLSIVGYEALGRSVRAGQVTSLGPFFQNKTIPQEKQLVIDRIIRNRAITQMADLHSDAKLFININPSWVYKQYKESGFLLTLQMIEQQKLDPSRVVIEITEEDFSGNLDELSDIIHVYRQAGCTLAIDDIGSGFSNYDRIASLKPQILKVDMRLLKNGIVHGGYHAVLKSFSILASQIGASLLVEGVETREDLAYALRVGARYIQGFLFSPAQAHFQHPQTYEELLRDCIDRYTQSELMRQRQLYNVMDQFKELIPSDAETTNEAEADAFIQSLLNQVPDHVVCIYICKEEGLQISSNYIRGEDGLWSSDVRARGANWIWRPYFITTVLQSKHGNQGCLSQEYIDLESSASMQTYSAHIGGSHYLFLDLII